MTQSFSVLATLVLMMTGSAPASVTVAQDADHPPVEPTETVTLEEKVDQVFSDVDGPTGPGCALSVMKDGAIIYRRGYGMANLEYGVPITPASVFHIASTSKQFTAMAVALLVAEGKVSWDDDVREYVPEVPELGHRITLRHLVHHTSGLRDQWELLIMAGWRWEADLVTQGDVLDLLARQRALNFAPGEEMLYSNTGFTVLAAVVERVSGKSLRQFTEDRIFQPLGMDASHFHDDHQHIVPNRAYGYAPNSDQELRISIPDFAIVGATSLFTTVEDLARWDRNFYARNVGGAAVLDDLLERGVLNDGEELDFAKGLIHSSHGGLATVSHGGGDAGYRAQLFRFPEERFSVAVLCNVPSGDPTGRARKVADIYLSDVYPEPPEQEEAEETGEEAGDERAAATRDTASEEDVRDRLAGYYLWPQSDIGLPIVWHDGALRFGGEDGAPLVPVEALTFRVGTHGEQRVTFELDDDGLRRIHLSDASGFPGRSGVTTAAEPPGGAETFDELVGEYWSGEVGAFYRFELVDGEPHLWNRKHGSMRLTPIYHDGFSFYFDVLAIAFTRDTGGRVTGFTMSGPRVRKVSFQRVERSR